MRISLSVPDDFAFGNAVCSHGFFMLAPNRWNPSRHVLNTAMAMGEERAVAVRIGEARSGRVSITSSSRLSGAERTRVKLAVRRMLRLDESFAGFHARCRASRTHRLAAKVRFGRLIRSATLFEDMVKVICTCNVTWRQTVQMVEQLVHHWGVRVENGDARSFPTPARLADAGCQAIQEQGRLGYRAPWVWGLADAVASGRLNLADFERCESSDELYRRLRRIKGVGAYAAGSLLMLLGHYDRLAVDTEMVRHLRQRYPRRTWTPAAIRGHYARWTPWSYLAYWFELWQGYVENHGRAEQWDLPTGRQITS